MNHSRLVWSCGTILASIACLPLAAPAAAPAAPAAARAGCTDFVWDVHHERSLFAGPAQSLRAGTAPASAPSIRADHFYALQLSPQPHVQFEAPPGKVMLTDGDYAGLVRFRLAAPGSYRVSLDRPFWIDVVAHGKLLPTEDFQGQRGCRAPHKIVEFMMPAHEELWLQFSGASAAQVHVAITRAPAPAAGAH